MTKFIAKIMQSKHWKNLLKRKKKKKKEKEKRERLGPTIYRPLFLKVYEKTVWFSKPSELIFPHNLLTNSFALEIYPIPRCI